jgi:3-deoxy-D-manno-octulosonic acid (KDO) 8-phosphate synthase
LFLEAHPDPMSAKCDAASQMQMDNMENLLKLSLAVRKAIGSPENVGTFKAPHL